MKFKKLSLTLIFLFFASEIFAVESFAVKAGESDVRYRSIIYLYPSAQIISEEELPKSFNEFVRVDALPDVASKAVVAFSIIKNFEETYPVPDNQYLSYFGRGISKNQADSIQSSKHALIVDVAYPRKMSPEGIKPVSTFLYETATRYGGLIWDSETRELFEPNIWKEKRIDSWDGSVPNVDSHTVIHAYKNDDGVRALTLGMAKFGLPDIVVNNFSWSLNKPMGNLINLVAQSIVEGDVISTKNTLKVNINKLNDTAYKHKLIATLKKNAVTELDIEYREAKREEGDPYNDLLELLFENAQGKSLSEKQENALSAIFGWEDSISYVKHNKQILDASDRAKRKLNGLRTDFQAGLAPGEFIQVKAPFTTPDGGNEWMWVEIISWEGDVIKGLLKNEPFNIPDLKGGSEVVVDQNEVFDYIRNFPNGTSEGNETGELIMKYQR